MKRVLALTLVGALSLGLAPTPAAAETDPLVADASLVTRSSTLEIAVAPVPGIADLEGALPPVARNVLGVIRVIKGVGARNRVYREARSVQREIRGYYDAQLQTARRQLEERSQLGLDDSQVRAYVRVYERLVAERQLALVLTEDEKRVAKYGFEATLKSEITAALVRTPRFRRGMERAREAVQEVRGAFDQARVAIEGGNPITAALEDVRGRLDRLERDAQIAALVLPGVGNTLGDIAGEVREQVDRAEAAVDEAAGAARTAIEQLDGVTADVDASLEAGRTERAETAMNRAADQLFERVFTPRGGEAPERDAVADAIARNALTAQQRNVGVALGAIDPSDFRRMRDRVSAAMLGTTLERIGDICGRLVGEARRLQMAAAAAGEAPPDTSTPCELFGSPDALQALIDAGRGDEEQSDDEAPDGQNDDAPTSDEAPDVAEPAGESHPADGTYTGDWTESEFGFEVPPDENRMVVTIADGLATLEGRFAVTDGCDEDGGGVQITVDYDFAGQSSTPLPPEPPFDVAIDTTFTIGVEGRCPPTDDLLGDIGNEIMDDLDGFVGSGTGAMTVNDTGADIVFDFGPEVESLSLSLTKG